MRSPFLVLALAALALPGSATASSAVFSKPQTPTAVTQLHTPADVALVDLASRQTHGWADVERPYPELEAKLAAGERIYVPCGFVSMLAKRRMDRMGVPARLVGTLRKPSAWQAFLDVPDAVGESHAMIEVWIGGRWVLYDLDANAQPLDRFGHPVTLARLSRLQVRTYRTLTDDKPVKITAATPNPVYERWLFSHYDEWLERILDVPSVMPYGESRYVYTGAERLPFDGYRWVGMGAWHAAVKAKP